MNKRGDTMKIKYDMNENYKKIYNESQGIFRDINKIKDDKNYKIRTLFQMEIVRFCLYILEILLFISLFIINSFDYVFLIFSIIMVVVTIVYYFRIYCLYKEACGVDRSGVFEINEEGIWDYSKNDKIFLSWGNFDCVVIGNCSITFILPPMKSFLSMSLDKEKEVLKALKKYNPNFKIIDKRK